MIEINLIGKTKEFKMPVVLGIDLAKINAKMVIVMIILMYIVDMGVHSITQSRESSLDGELLILRQEVGKLRKEVKLNKEIQNQIDELAQQEERLKARMGIVSKIIRNKKNPVKIMLYISKNIPDDIWVGSIKIIQDKLTIEGTSFSYKSIGIFLENLKSSIYFDSSFSFVGSETKVDPKTGKRTEKFKLEGKIVRYN